MVAEFIEKLSQGLRDSFGITLHAESVKALSGGAATEIYYGEISAATEHHKPAVIRRSHGGKPFAGALSKRQEAAVQAAAHRYRVPTPAVYCDFQDHWGIGEGYVMEYCRGETLPQKILRDDQFALVRGDLTTLCGTTLAAIHQVPKTAVSMLPQRTAQESLTILRNIYDSYALDLPIFNFAFRYLTERLPTKHAMTLVHGDFRLGNLMVDTATLLAVLDWELAHIGDPMEDLGWLCVNAWRFGNSDLPVGGFGLREALFEAYEATTGTRVDPHTVQYWELFGVLKWGVICLYQTQVHLKGEERSVERAAIGRRVSETELDIMNLIVHGWN